MTATNQNPKPLRGWINKYFVNQNGIKRGPYYARVWKVGRKTHKEYIKPADVEKVRAACDAYRQLSRARRANDKSLTITLDNLAFLNRMVKRSERARLTTADIDHIERIRETGYAAPGRPKHKYEPRMNVARSSSSFGGSGRRPMGPHDANPNSIAIDCGHPSRQLPAANRQPQKFMVPQNKKIKALARFKTQSMRIFRSINEPETTEQKWKRWQEEKPLIEMPKRNEFPDWLDKDKLINLLQPSFTALKLKAKRNAQSTIHPHD